MDRIIGWILAAGILVALGGLWVVSQTVDYEPEPSCVDDQPIDELSDLFDASIDLNQRLPTEDPVVQGPFRRTRSESRDACVVIWTRSSEAMITRAVVEIYLDPSAANAAFRYAESPERRDAYADAVRFIDDFVYFNIDLSKTRPGATWGTTHLLGCVVVRTSWRADELPTNLWSPESRDELVRRAFVGFEQVCASAAA